jgi:hypothetical protein
MSCLPVFPAQNSIPPPSFYSLQGLSGWLENNPSYKQYFAGLIPGLLAPELITSTLSSLNYTYQHVPLCGCVITLNSSQLREYNQQIQIFRKIYGYNSNAYVNYVCGVTSAPIYYTYKDQQERTQMRSAQALINKLYDFNAMSEASTLNWQVPFPIRN